MKFVTKTGTYTSPNVTQGLFEGAYIEDIAINHRRKEKYLSVTFGLLYEQNGKTCTLAKSNLVFYGVEANIDIPGATSNQTSLVDIPNPGYDPDYFPGENASEEEIKAKSREYLRHNLIAYLENNNYELPEGAVIVDYGFPTYERVLEFFQGGNIDNPELFVNSPIAIGFLMSKLIINSEPVKEQFQLEQ